MYFKLRKLYKLKESYQQKIIEIREAGLDPNIEAHYINDVEYAIYCVDGEIEFEKRMRIFNITLYAFGAFAVGLTVWAYIKL